MQGYGADLDGETGQDQENDKPPVRGGSQPGAEFMEIRIAQRKGDQYQGHQQQRLTDHGQDHVDPPGTTCRRAAIVNDKAIGGEGHQCKKQIEARHVQGQNHSQIAGQSKQVEELEADLPGVRSQRGPGVDTGGGPDQAGQQ
jgi:hypothetical protein